MKRLLICLYVICMALTLHANDSDSIRLTLLEEQQDEYVFCLHNDTRDSIYLFDNYFELCYEGYIYTSMYVHRYDKKKKTYKLSLLPLLPTIRPKGCLHNALPGGRRDKLIKSSIFAFTFTTIAPHDSLLVRIQKEAFLSTLYVNDIYPERLSCFRHLLPKMKKTELKRVPDEIIFELGVYKKVDNLLKWCNEVTMDEIDEQARAMIVVSVPVHVNKE